MFLGSGQWQVVGLMIFGGLGVKRIDSKNTSWFGCGYSLNRKQIQLNK